MLVAKRVVRLLCHFIIVPNSGVGLICFIAIFEILDIFYPRHIDGDFIGDEGCDIKEEIEDGDIPHCPQENKIDESEYYEEIFHCSAILLLSPITGGGIITASRLSIIY